MCNLKKIFVGGLALITISAPGTAQSVERPEIVAFNSTVTAMESDLADHCDSQTTRRIDPPFLPDVQNEQMQIDCEGFSFLGQPRHAEFVFRDDSLVMVWILTEAAEEPAILAQMRTAYGAPSHDTEPYVAFMDYRTALRREPPEVLFFSDVLADAYAGFFSQSGAE